MRTLISWVASHSGEMNDSPRSSLPRRVDFILLPGAKKVYCTFSEDSARFPRGSTPGYQSAGFSSFLRNSRTGRSRYAKAYRLRNHFWTVRMKKTLHQGSPGEE